MGSHESVSSAQPTTDLAMADVTPLRPGPWQVPDGWQQGRGAWGGLVIAAVLRAAAGSEVDEGHPDRLPRSVTAEIVAPVLAGEALIECTQVRRGSATATWSVRIDSAGETATRASVVFGDPRKGEPLDTTPARPPDVADWRDIPVVELGPPIAPPFLQHLSMRPISGFPVSGSQDDIVMWLTYPQGRLDAAALLALVDGPWPVALVRSRENRPMATLSFFATLLVDPQDLPPGEPLLYRSRLLGQHDGYTTEQRELWTADGRLAVENVQLITLIR